MNLENQKRNYAKVLVVIGLGLKKDQSVVIEAPVEQFEFVKLITEEAYKAGSNTVSVLWKYNALEKLNMENSKIQSVEFERKYAEYYAEQGAGFIRLDVPDTKIFQGMDAELINRKALEDGTVRKIFRTSSAYGGHTIACIPCQSWADIVFPDIAQEKRMDALWDAVLSCVRCKEDDPIASWKNYINDTAKRKETLDLKQYKAYHYKSEKTDIMISPVENHKWHGGCIEYNNVERVFVPNIPTEEVFTVPHKLKVDGYVSSTVPLNYRGQLIEDFVLHIENGKIISYSARKGEQLLKAIIETDEGSHYLGEIALIDQKSPIASLNRVFYTTLYDENASCHMAIGTSNNSPYQTKEESEKAGYNYSIVHVDFMIGSDDMNIMGQLDDNLWESIMINGRWSI